jgi:flagellar biosynthetic protein FlhB
MSEEQAGEKTHDASEKKKEKSKDKGTVLRSRDLTIAIMTLVSALMLVNLGGNVIHQLANLMTTVFSAPHDTMMKTDEMWEMIVFLVAGVLKSLAPFFLLLMVTALVSPAALGGYLFSLKLLAFKPEKLNPISGIKKMFSAQSAMELFKTLAKFLFILTFGLSILWIDRFQILGLGNMDFADAITGGFNILGKACLVLTVPLLLVSMLDSAYQVYSHNQKLRMTHQEVKDENKDSDGNPETKQKIRQAQQAISQQRMAIDVPQADLVLTNPTHFAVAIKFDQAKDAAPRILAKGKGWQAQQIMDLARQHAVNLYAAPPVTRALYFTSEIGDTIPEGLFLPVAKILAYFYQLDSYKAGKGTKPDKVKDFTVPSEYYYAPVED